MARFVAWCGFLFAAVSSLAANVAHAQDHLGARLVAAFAPVALVLAVEVAARVEWAEGRKFWIARWVGTGGVALITFVVSYRSQEALFVSYKVDDISAAILPLSVDGLMLVCIAALLSLGPATAGDTAVVAGAAVAPVSPDVAAEVRHEGDTIGDSPTPILDVAPVARLSHIEGDTSGDNGSGEATVSADVASVEAILRDIGWTSHVEGAIASDSVSAGGDMDRRRAARSAARARQRATAKARERDTGDNEATGE